MNFKMVKLSDMRCDMSYQRTPNDKWVRDIYEKWDDMKANIVDLSLRDDGKYYVINGNHTRLAAVKAGKTELPCRVYTNLNVEDEARLFTELNSEQKKPKYAEILRAKVAAGSQPETSYIKALDDLGIPYTYNQSSGRRVKCHSALLSIFKKTSIDLMRRALKVANDAADGRDVFYQNGYFPGICSLIVNHPEVDDVRLITLINKTTSSKVMEIADRYKRAVTTGSMSATLYFRKAYIDIYNKGLRSGSKRIEE